MVVYAGIELPEPVEMISRDWTYLYSFVVLMRPEQLNTSLQND